MSLQNYSGPFVLSMQETHRGGVKGGLAPTGLLGAYLRGMGIVCGWVG